ncbi:lysophospholipid acyltransferase family protein [Dyadobacter sp. LJ53]|uniref:lysophospholipid acyltransferase family protein n=1 Tax=Dyadobacter chenwenxiniae TaxID=2906456 RepID=UPI001F23208E|nr:lysophospholipid acyltransferase family protein [Dyadobacter chenwenxiniae]MCF0051676.1 lysophospholipid acyltransferase family protein [Dyadobacter chenwenxiniae]
MRIKQSLQVIAYKSVYAGAYAISLLPMTFLYAMASFTFFFAFYIPGYRKAIVIQNMARCFPSLQYGEISGIAKKFYKCFTAYFAEIIKSISAPAAVLNSKIVFENLELIDRHINAGRNVIASMGHCGNWEMLNIMPHKISHDIYAVYKPLHSPVMNRVMIKLRSRFGMKLTPEKSVIRHLLTQKSSPAIYLFLADQCPSIKQDQYKFELLNQETYIVSGMEKLARASGAAVVYLHITQQSKGNYKLKCLPVCSDAKVMNEGEVTQKYVDLLTENINEEPYGWLWTHRRWKR